MEESRLRKLVSSKGEFLEDENGIGVFHVRSPHILTQAAGYLKYILAKEKPMGVFFRGQRTLYEGLIPTLYRGIGSQASKKTRDDAIKAYLQTIKDENKVLRNVPDYAREPLLQHYGIRTRWIDVIDNVWVALWFACHRAQATGDFEEYLHFERREPLNDEDKYAYILLVAIEMAGINTTKPGLYQGFDTDLIDLRIAAPSTYLRPHAQHGLLFRRVRQANHDNMDCADFTAGIIRVDLVDALTWLGEGKFLGSHALFPPPLYDFGYRDLLDKAPRKEKFLGAIHHIGA